MSQQNPFQGLGKVFFSLCKGINSPVSLGCWLLYANGEHLQLAKKTIDPKDYVSASDFESDYLVISYFSKYKGLDTGLDLEQEAFKRFTDAEFECENTNRRLKSASKSGFPPRTSTIISMAIRKIDALLGDFSYSKVLKHVGWGPGATSDLTRSRALLDTKICELPISVSRTALSYFRAFVENDLHWSRSILGVYPEGAYSLMPNVFLLNEECVVDTVDKNATTKRVITKSNRANGFLQKGAGGYIRDRLLLVGVNLRDQGRNQRLAQTALRDSSATIDLKAASDTVATEVPRLLLHPLWFEYLDRIRERRALFQSESIHLHKFSSMGNGFTFELESLIFWSIASSVKDLNQCEGAVSVYGDDIIVPQGIVQEVISTLQFLGFTTNKTKSFVDGVFFESCGKHYFEGHDVTPIYQKDTIGDPEKPLEDIAVCNRLLRYAARKTDEFYLDDRIRSAWLAARRLVSAAHSHTKIPLGELGDDAILLPDGDFGIAQSDRSTGYRCPTVNRRLGCFPAIEIALLSFTLRVHKDRRFSLDPLYSSMLPSDSILNESYEFYGDIEVLRSGETYGYRWVVPNRQFQRKWC